MFAPRTSGGNRLTVLTALAIASVMAFGMAGCSKSGSETSSTSPDNKLSKRTSESESVLTKDASETESELPADNSEEDYTVTVEKIIRASKEIWDTEEANAQQKLDLKNGSDTDYPHGVYVTFDHQDSVEIYTPKKNPDDPFKSVDLDSFDPYTIEEVFYFYKTEDSLTYTQTTVFKLSSEGAADAFYEYMKEKRGSTEEEIKSMIDSPEMVGGFKEDENMQAWFAAVPEKRIAMSGNYVEKRGRLVIYSHIDGIYNDVLLNEYIEFCDKVGLHEMEQLLK